MMTLERGVIFCVLIISGVVGLSIKTDKVLFELDEQNLTFEFFKKNGDSAVSKLAGKFLLPPVFKMADSLANGTIWIRNVTEECVNVQVRTRDAMTCFEYGKDFWFGGAERHEQYWPIQELKIRREPFVTMESNYQAVLEPYWINSKGASIYVSAQTPLFIDSHHIENNSLCLYASDTPPYNHRVNVTLELETCAFDDVRQAHVHGINRYLGKPTDIPDERMFRHPIWSTWARYKREIDHDKVLQYAKEIIDYGFNNSQLEIDDKWEPCYGDMRFDLGKFPNMSDLTRQLKEMGYRTSLWVTPFVNYNCEPIYSQCINEGRFVVSDKDHVSTWWWNGLGAHIDFTNKTTKEWWTNRLKTLMDENGIDSIKFDAGETSWLPQLPRITVDSQLYPDDYPRFYVDTALEFGKFVEVRVGRRTQSRPVFVRMIDKDSRWGLNNGLKSLLTTLFQMNIAGYPFVLPDMIGGNGYFFLDKLTKELFLRWLQANTLMPALQFSYAPWDFDDETVEISRKFVKLHDEFTDEILEVAKKSVTHGYPINPPIWWIDPTDEDSLKCRDEYLLGENVLVAPVLDEGKRSRDIYLPQGHWKDLNHVNDEVIEGRVWLRNYTVGLDELPVFRRLT